MSSELINPIFKCFFRCKFNTYGLIIIFSLSFDKNIQIPAYLLGYRTPGHNEREAYVMEMISIPVLCGDTLIAILPTAEAP